MYAMGGSWACFIHEVRLSMRTRELVADGCNRRFRHDACDGIGSYASLHLLIRILSHTVVRT